MNDDQKSTLWHWYLGKDLIATSPVREFTLHNRLYIPENLAFLCPLRGEIWARIYRPDASFWGIESRPSNPGFLLPFNPQWINIAPKPILLREVLLASQLPDPTTYEIQLIMRNYL